MKKFIVPVARAAAQALVGAVLAFLLVHFGVHVSAADQAELIAVLTSVFTGLVAKGQQYLEKRYPWLGSFLKSPSYDV